MWTTAATFYGLMFVDFPSLQQLGLLIGHSMVVCGVLTLVMVPALLPRRAPRRRRSGTADAAARRVDRQRHRARDSRRRGARRPVALGLAATRLRDRSDARSPAIGDRRRAARGAIGPTVRPAGRVYVVLAEGPISSRCCRRTSAWLSALSADDARTSRSSRRRALLPSAGHAGATGRRDPQQRLSPTSVRASLRACARSRAISRPAAFDPFRRAAAAPARSAASADVRRLRRARPRRPRRTLRRPRTAPAGAGDVRVSGERRAGGSRPGDRRATVDPAQTLTGLPLVNRELARTFLPQFLKGLAIGTLMVVVLVVGGVPRLAAVDATRCCRPRSAWSGRPALLAHCRRRARSVRRLRRRDVRRHRRRLRHPSRPSLSANAATRSAPIAELAPVILVGRGDHAARLRHARLTSSYPPLRSIGVVSAVSVVALAAASVLVLPALLLSEAPARGR